MHAPRLIPLVLLAAATSAAAPVAIDHDGVGCVVAERFPELRATLTPAEDVAEARVRFRPDGGTHWYSVRLTRGAQEFTAVLPRPRKALAGFVYYIEVVQRDLGLARSGDYAPRVVAGPAACREKVVATSLARAVVDLEVPVGAPLNPPGFMTALGAPAAAAGGAAVSTSTGLAVAVVGAGAAAAGIAVASGSGSGGGAAPTVPPATTTPTTTATPSTTVPSAGALTGHWTGFCDLREETPNGVCVQALTLVAELTQSGSVLGGTLVATMTSSTGPCESHAGDVYPGTVTGTTQGDRVEVVSRYATDWMVMTGTVVGRSMGGDITATSSNARGTWRLER